MTLSDTEYNAVKPSGSTGKRLYTVLKGIVDKIANKVDKVSGKGLSTNDYTTTEKNKLAAVGTKYPNTTGYGSFSKSVPSSTDATYMGKFTLPSTGVWIMHIYFDCPADADGYRYVCFGTSETDSTRRAEYASASCPGGANVRGRAQFTYLTDTSTTENLTFYIWGAQNCGAAKTCRVYYRCVKVAP